MSFANTHLLWLMPAAIILGLFAHFYGRQQQRKMSRWINRSLWQQVIPEYSDRVYLVKNITLTLCLFFMAFSLARPQWGEKEELIQSNGMDVLFLLDLSNSMLAEDVPPSRLNRAQTFIKKTLNTLADDRVGIVAFAGSAYLAAPLTTDFGYISEVVDSLDPNAISNQGTDIGLAIDVGMKAFERGGEDDHKTSRAFVLISDGEDFGEEANQAAEKLKKFGAGFFVMSVGLGEGAPIPLRNEAGILQTYKKDNAGKPILSRVNKEHLSKIADLGGGKFTELVNADDAAYTLSKQLLSFGRDSNKEQRQVTKIDRYPYFLAIAIFFLFLHLCVGYSKAKIKRVKGISLGLIFLGFLGHDANAQTLDSYLNSKQAKKLYETKDFENSAAGYDASRKEDTENPAIQFNQGTALAKAKRNDEAVVQLQEATKKSLATGDYETAAKSLYNEGVTRGEMKNIPESYDRLSKAIEMAKISKQPELEKKAREALAAIAQQQQQQQKDKDKKDDQKNDSGQDQKKEQEKKDPKDDKDQKDQKDKKDQKGPPKSEDGKKREFKSGTLSKDVAESVMNDLSDREKQLYKKRMKERKSREAQNDKDW